MIADCCEILALKAREAGIELVVQLGRKLPEIVADKRALNQIMLNLLSNAIKFSNAGGKVTVGAEADDDAIALSVDDTGVGIGADDLARVGDPFFQARSSYDRRHDGTGLGLSIVKGLVALHGGRIDIRSRLGEGTRVTVDLPLDCRAARPRKRPVADGDGGRTSAGPRGRQHLPRTGEEKCVVNPLATSRAASLLARLGWGRGDAIAVAIGVGATVAILINVLVDAGRAASGADVQGQARRSEDRGGR